MQRKLPKSFTCPSEFTLVVLGGKWKTVILCFLKQRPCRYSELRKLVPRLSDKMLTQRLADLTADGLIKRQKKSADDKESVYALTERGQSLANVLGGLYAWGHEHAPAFGVKVDDPFRRLD
jgi:DNA-binding HxlR family transcriptional regulator